MTPSIGLDVYQATISAAIRNSDGKLVLEAILETKAETMLQFIHVLRRHDFFDYRGCGSDNL
jgi:hypothetical protein